MIKFRFKNVEYSYEDSDYRVLSKSGFGDPGLFYEQTIIADVVSVSSLHNNHITNTDVLVSMDEKLADFVIQHSDKIQEMLKDMYPEEFI